LSYLSLAKKDLVVKKVALLKIAELKEFTGCAISLKKILIDILL